jgi:hypothetical protein
MSLFGKRLRTYEVQFVSPVRDPEHRLVRATRVEEAYSLEEARAQASKWASRRFSGEWWEEVACGPKGKLRPLNECTITPWDASQ